MTTLVKLIIALKVLLWIGLGILLYTYAPEVGDSFSGPLARFDFAIGYAP